MQKTILYICVSIIVISIFYTLIPTKNMESTMKFILNLFLISIIIIPLVNSISKINFNEYNNILKKNDINTKNLNEEIEKSNENVLKNALKIVFSQNGYNDLDISIKINKDSKTTNIYIKIPTNKNYDINKIKEITKNQTGITPHIEMF